MESKGCLKLNVGGQVYMTTTHTLTRLPDTRLARLAAGNDVTKPDKEFFFDRNPDIMNSVLDLYRTGELHLPKHLCGNTVERELKFWEIPTEMIQECCYKVFEEHKDGAHITKEIDQFLKVPYETQAEIDTLRGWNRIWLIMERPRLCWISKVWNTLYFTLVVLSVLFFCLETTMTFRTVEPWVPTYAASINITSEQLIHSLDLTQKYGSSKALPWLRHTQEAIFVFFVIEFFVRLASCPGKRYFLRQMKTWLDVFLLLQNGITIVLDTVVLQLRPLSAWGPDESNALIFFYSLSVLRVLRIFYLAKTFDTMKILILSTKASIKVLALLAIFVLCLATLFGASVFLAELLADAFTFSSIPYSMWYAVVTMTTVGYGDVVPVSTVGRLLGMLCALSGVIIMALPIAVIASRFTTYHDNISARHQRRSRLDFLKENPGFDILRKEEGEGEGEDDRRPRAGKVEGKSVPEEGEVKAGKGVWFSLCSLVRRNPRKVNTRPVWVSEYKGSSSSSTSTSSSSTTSTTTAPRVKGVGHARFQSHSPGSVEEVTDLDFSSQLELVNQC